MVMPNKSLCKLVGQLAQRIGTDRQDEVASSSLNKKIFSLESAIKCLFRVIQQ